MPGTIGNQNAAKGNRWAEAINAALELRSRRDQVIAINELAEQLISLGMAGDLGALKEIGDRLDGKARQSTEITGADGGPVQITEIVIRSVKPQDHA